MSDGLKHLCHRAGPSRGDDLGGAATHFASDCAIHHGASDRFFVHTAIGMAFGVFGKPVIT